MKKILTLTLALALICLCLFACAAPAQEAPAGEAKAITVNVTKDGETKEIAVETAEKYLGPALQSEGIIDGEKSDYGLFVTTVDGITVNADAQEWWNILVDGESAPTGVDEIEVADGAVYEFVFTVGW